MHPNGELEITVTAPSNATNKSLKRETKCNIAIYGTKIVCPMCSKKVKDLEGHINRQHQSNWARNQQTSDYNSSTEKIKEFGESSKVLTRTHPRYKT